MKNVGYLGLWWRVGRKYEQENWDARKRDYWILDVNVCEKILNILVQVFGAGYAWTWTWGTKFITNFQVNKNDFPRKHSKACDCEKIENLSRCFKPQKFKKD